MSVCLYMRKCAHVYNKVLCTLKVTKMVLNVNKLLKLKLFAQKIWLFRK